jgi:hypothetical protein
MKTFIFYAEHAEKYGMEEATLLYNFLFWAESNRARGHNLHDGRHWMFWQLHELADLFPFWSTKQVRRIRDSLIAQGALLVRKDLNQFATDRTCWYALSDENGMLSDLPKRANGKAQTGNSTFAQTGNSDLPKRANDNKDTDKHSDKHSDKQGERVTAPAPEVSGSVELLDFAAPTVTPAITLEPVKRFKPPTLEEVKAYWQEKGHPGGDAQAEAFWDHHETWGWKNGPKSMKNWQRATNTWVRNISKFSGNRNATNYRPRPTSGTNLSAASIARIHARHGE